MKNKRSILNVVMLSLLSVLIGNAQPTRKQVALTDLMNSQITLTNQPLDALIEEISIQTKMAICIEDVLSDADTGLRDMPITFSVLKGESILQVLERLHSLYPRVRWDLRGGIVILRDSKLEVLHDDPLVAKASETTINGTINDIKFYLEAGIEGFNPAIIETKGTVNRETTYELKVAAGMSARDVLTLLTRNFGLRWRARIRLERKQNPDAAFELPRVILSLMDGKIPKEVRRTP